MGAARTRQGSPISARFEIRVEDLGSANDTFVAGAVDPLPEKPIDPGQKREVGPDDRIYVGSWTRLVIRKAAPGEGT